MKNLKKYIRKYLAEAIVVAIRAYQATISPDHGMLKIFFTTYRCRFFPSCSDYAIDSIRQYGLLRGAMVSLRRITKCTPFNDGGYDPALPLKK